MTVRVLLVEDAMSDTHFGYTTLSKKPGFKLHRTDPKQISQGSLVQEDPIYDIIVHDLDPTDGLNIIAITQTKKRFPNTPLIILSAINNDEMAIEALNNGAHDYLIKSNAEMLIHHLHLAIARTQYQSTMNKPEGHFTLAISGARDGLWDWNLKTNKIYFSPRWKTILDYSESEISNSPDEWFKRVHPVDISKLRQDISQLKLGKIQTLENVHRVRTRENSYRWVLAQGISDYDGNNDVYRIAGSLTDVTQRHQADEILLFDAQHDALTFLPNRNYFMRLMNRRLGRMQGHIKKHFAVLSLNFNRYRAINDRLGHLIGDQLLIAFARRLETCLRPGDTVARLGEDEFAIFLDHISNIHETTCITERILMEITEPFNIEGHELILSTNIGIVMSSSGYERAEDILRDADLAMYQAKSKGKSSYEIFDKYLRDVSVSYLSMEMDLSRAIAQKDIQVHYQPIISLATGQITGFEALARWRHNNKDIPPIQFIRAAEENGLIISIGEHVLSTACFQLRAWQRAGLANDDVTISVNISSKQLSQPGLSHCIKNILHASGIDGRLLILEITENAVLENMGLLNQTLQTLKKLGVKCSLDNFGTGHASLSNLHRLPIDSIKVDRSFISGHFSHNSNRFNMVNAIIHMAHGIGMHVVAKGVENRKSLEHLQSLKCEYAQGYYFSPAVDANSAGQMLHDLPLWGATS